MEKTNFVLSSAMEVAAERYKMSFQEVSSEQEDGKKRVRDLLQNAVDAEWGPWELLVSGYDALCLLMYVHAYVCL